MKALFTSRKTALALIPTFGALFFPRDVFAGNALVNSTGVTDETLFLILTLIAAFQLVAILVIAGVIKSIVANKHVWHMHWNKGASVITALLVLASTQANAAEASFDSMVNMNDSGFIALLALNIFLLLAFLYLSFKLNGLMKTLMKDEQGNVPASFIDKINVLLTDAVPVEKEEDVLMDHEYDGIHELDNNLPPWWLYGFYFTIVFAVVYMVNFHVTGSSPLQIAEYQAEVEAAEAAKATFVAKQENIVDESNVMLLTDAASLAAGQKTFRLNCASCHAEHGGSYPGGVGPNLTDDYWIHGGSITDIFKVIKYGVAEKGMVSWQAQLNPTQMQQLASFIKSINGTNPENAKEPQGEIWKDTATEAAPTDSLLVSEGEVSVVE